MKIKEMIVVEGKSDKIQLSRFLDANILTTDGTHLSKEKMMLIREAQKKTGVIILTDPDFPGESIRNEINRCVPGCKNAFLNAEEARDGQKVGVEHAEGEAISRALKHLMTYQTEQETLSYEEYRTLRLSGHACAQTRRDRVGKHFHIGKCNGKTMFKRLNMLKVTYSELQDVLDGDIHG